nr:NADH-quinone oxidoreductase subunit C [Chrysiogenes arsenatis]
MSQSLSSAVQAKCPGIIKEVIQFRGQETFVVEAAHVATLIGKLRDEFGFAMLLDIAGIDYLTYPKPQPTRFALAYVLRNWDTNTVVCVKVYVNDPQAGVPTVSTLFNCANWAEREAFDQFGFIFIGHPNLKRILNHKDFVGHPLRKDYPITRRHILAESDSLMDEMVQRLKEKGV